MLIVEKLAKANLAQLYLKREQGELVSAEDVRHAQAAVALRLRDQLLQIPDRLAIEIAGESDVGRIREMLLDEIYHALEAVADALGKDVEMAASANA